MIDHHLRDNGMNSSLFRGSGEYLAIVNVVVLSERSRNHSRSTTFIYPCGRYVRSFEEHRGYQMASLQQIQIDMLMVGYLTPLLRFFLFRALVAEPTTAIHTSKNERKFSRLERQANDACDSIRSPTHVDTP